MFQRDDSQVFEKTVFGGRFISQKVEKDFVIERFPK